MKTLFSAIAMLASHAALAHDSLAPHSHPHGVSILPDLSAMLIAAAAIGAGFVIVRHLKRR